MSVQLDGQAIEIVSVPQGRILFRQGDKGDAAYIVNAGTVGIYREADGRKVLLATIRKGELFGEMAVIDGSPRMATAFAISECTLTVISAGNISEKMQKVDPFVKALIQMLMNNLRSVHNIYAPKSRSVLDAVNMIATQQEALAGFLAKTQNQGFHDVFAPKVRALQALVKDMRKLASTYRGEDQREDAMPHSTTPQDPAQTQSAPSAEAPKSGA